MLWRKFRLDWRYASGEFLIVVLGVLSAFWVENWNSERLDLLLERQYMQSLLDDLNSDVESIDVALRRTDTHTSGIRIVLNSIERESLEVTPVHFAEAVAFLSRLVFPVQSHATIDDLMSTGNLRIIRNTALRTAIADYYSFVDMQTQWQPMWRNYQEDMGRLVPRFIGLSVRAAVESELRKPDWWNSNREVTDSDAQQILRRLIDSPDAVPTIENIYRAQALNHAYSASLKSKATALIQIVETYSQQL